MNLKGMISSALGNKKVELVLDNCPLYDFSQAGRISVEEIETSIKIMKRINNIDDGR